MSVLATNCRVRQLTLFRPSFGPAELGAHHANEGRLDHFGAWQDRGATVREPPCNDCGGPLRAPDDCATYTFWIREGIATAWQTKLIRRLSASRYHTLENNTEEGSPF
jgi:hypothetical protein